VAVSDGAQAQYPKSRIGSVFDRIREIAATHPVEPTSRFLVKHKLILI
jgi:hypothetical protein